MSQSTTQKHTRLLTPRRLIRFIDPEVERRADVQLDAVWNATGGLIECYGPNGIPDYDQKPRKKPSVAKAHSCPVGVNIDLNPADARGDILTHCEKEARQLAQRLLDAADAIAAIDRKAVKREAKAGVA